MLAASSHARCLADPVLSHPFSHPDSESFGGHSAMLEIYARQGADQDLGRLAPGAVVEADLPVHRWRWSGLG